MTTFQIEPPISLPKFEDLLKQERFKHVKYDLVSHCNEIRKIFQKKSEIYSFADGLISVPYNHIYVSGGHFFEYSEDNPYAIMFPDLFKEFRSNRKIDLYFTCDFANMDIKSIFKQRYTTPNGTLMSLDLYHNEAPITINYFQLNDETRSIKTGADAIYNFDAELCKVAYHIENETFEISSWFRRENDHLELFPKNVEPLRQLKFKMKGFYNQADESVIYAAAAKTFIEIDFENRKRKKEIIEDETQDDT